MPPEGKDEDQASWQSKFELKRLFLIYTASQKSRYYFPHIQSTGNDGRMHFLITALKDDVFRTKRSDDDTSEEEKEWLNALEAGELDDSGRLKKEKDPKLLTARQVRKCLKYPNVSGLLLLSAMEEKCNRQN